MTSSIARERVVGYREREGEGDGGKQSERERVSEGEIGRVGERERDYRRRVGGRVREGVRRRED